MEEAREKVGEEVRWCGAGGQIMQDFVGIVRSLEGSYAHLTLTRR